MYHMAFGIITTLSPREVTGQGHRIGRKIFLELSFPMYVIYLLFSILNSKA